MSSRPGIGGPGLMRRIRLVPVLLLAVSACGPRDAGEQVEEASEPRGRASCRPAGADASPRASAEAVLAYLTAADFRNSWDLWPGKGEKYEGTEPHGALLTTYLNPAAAQAAADGAGQMPPGAIVVKDNFMPDGMLGASTVMYKIEATTPRRATGGGPSSCRTAAWTWTAWPRGASRCASAATPRVRTTTTCSPGVSDSSKRRPVPSAAAQGSRIVS